MECSACGTPIADETSRFCSNCGAAQRLPEDLTPSAMAGQSPPSLTSESASSPSWSVSERPLTGQLPPLGRIDVGMLTFLSTITLGIYFLVWLYRAMRQYRALSGRAGANLDQLFWATVIAFGAAIVLSVITGGLGVLALIAGIVLEALLINEVVKDRDAAAPANIRPLLPSAGLLVTLLVVSNVASLTICGLIIGIPVAIWFYYRFFTGHNLLVESTESGGQGQPRPYVS